MGNRVTLSRFFFLSIFSMMISFVSSFGLAYQCGFSSITYCGQSVPVSGCVSSASGDSNTHTQNAVVKCNNKPAWDLANAEYGQPKSNVWACSSITKKEICNRLPGHVWNGQACTKDGAACSATPSLAAKEPAKEIGSCGDNSLRLADNRCICKPGYVQYGEDDTCAPEVKVITNETPEETIQTCVQRNIAEAKDCTDKAATTKTLCEKYEKENETSVGVKSFIQTIASGVLQNAQNKASGAMGTSSSNQTLCAATSLASSASASLMNGMMKSCENEQVECTKSCKKDKALNLRDLCSGYAKGGKDKLTDGDIKYIQNEQSKYNTKIETADKYCQIEAPKKNDLLSQTLGDALKAQAAAQSCACANAIDASTCGPTAEQCLANPSLAGCATTPYAINCSLGSADFSQPNCVCLREPSSPSCKTALTSNINNMGTDIKVPTAGDVGLPAVAGTTGDFSSDMDLSSARPEVSSDSTKAVGKLNTIGETVSGGGGGGLSAPGVGGNGAAASAGEEDKSVVTGAFNSLKSAIGSVFGGGKSAGNGNARGKGDVNFDPDKFKNPKGLRGLASSGMGTKNMDIFKMINTRHIDQDKGGRFFDPSFNPK